MLFQAFSRLREVSAAVAASVVSAAHGANVTAPPAAELVAQVARAMWEPRYEEYRQPGIDPASE